MLAALQVASDQLDSVGAGGGRQDDVGHVCSSRASADLWHTSDIMALDQASRAVQSQSREVAQPSHV
jgi:hypothetical protein